MPRMQTMTPAQLKSIRATLGWSQQRLADELGVQRNTVARWEMGMHPISPMAARLVESFIARAPGHRKKRDSADIPRPRTAKGPGAQ